MDPARYQELVQFKQSELGDDRPLLLKVDSYRVPTVSTDFARELLDAALVRRLTGGELLALFEEASLADLGRVAQILRLERADSRRVTYIIDRNVTYTNLCYADCGFCAFNRHQGDGDEYLLELSEILDKCRSVTDAGGNQILLQGGHHPKKRLPYYEEMLAGIKAGSPNIWIHGFSPSEIQHFGRLNGIPTMEVLKRLQAAGLDSIPGGGAEILSDRVRQILAPGKSMAGEWIGIMEEAHAIGLPTTVTMMFAHIETYAERVEHLLRVRDSQDKTGGYTAFIPWTYQEGQGLVAARLVADGEPGVAEGDPGPAPGAAPVGAAVGEGVEGGGEPAAVVAQDGHEAAHQGFRKTLDSSWSQARSNASSACSSGNVGPQRSSTRRRPAWSAPIASSKLPCRTARRVISFCTAYATSRATGSLGRLFSTMTPPGARAFRRAENTLGEGSVSTTKS